MRQDLAWWDTEPGLRDRRPMRSNKRELAMGRLVLALYVANVQSAPHKVAHLQIYTQNSHFRHNNTQPPKAC